MPRSQHLQLLDHVNYGLANELLVCDQRAACQVVNPILVPKTLQKLGVKAALKDLVRNLVVFVSVEAEIFKLLARNHGSLVPPAGVLKLISVRILVSTEAAQLYLAGRHGPLRVHHDSDGRVLNHLHTLLGLNVNSGEPAAVSRMGMVPSADEFGTVNFRGFILMVQHEIVSFLACVHTCLSTFYWQAECVHDIHGVADGIPLHEAHHLNITSGLCVHNHFY
jgi:hypothetical protein